ncbi:hypothetical protein [Sphingobacterium zeae]|uniref:Uncharacterized protein n=1 Tax=Sphingobacterium zeae TaxID=1776859 RepID=A0ABU0U6G0_9SPHI|nr:hypothetical protein [Sphingobacterium zeae]MDQ1150514.1 hypothetical protein [Sphingobacterium zeae]
MPNSRRSLERNMYLLNELLSRGKIKINVNERNITHGIQNVRRAPNRRSYLNSISESANAIANQGVAMAKRFGDKFYEDD